MKPFAPVAMAIQRDLETGSEAEFYQGFRRERAYSPPRLAFDADLTELLRLEMECFEEWRRDTPRVIKNSLHHPQREVWVIPDDETGGLAAALFLRWDSGRLRIYSLATDSRHQGQGLGRLLMRFALNQTVRLHADCVILEVDSDRADLLSWYERMGFRRFKLLRDFYAPDKDAWRLIK